jgi:hypothetical protein
MSYIPHRPRARVIGSGWVYHMPKIFGEDLARPVKLTHFRNPILGELHLRHDSQNRQHDAREREHNA